MNEREMLNLALDVAEASMGAKTLRDGAMAAHDCLSRALGGQEQGVRPRRRVGRPRKVRVPAESPAGAEAGTPA